MTVPTESTAESSVHSLTAAGERLRHGAQYPPFCLSVGVEEIELLQMMKGHVRRGLRTS